MTVADELFSADLLPENVYDKISNESHPTYTARETTRAVTKKVEYQQLNFLKFIDVLKKTNMVAIADTLEKRSKYYYVVLNFSILINSGERRCFAMGGLDLIGQVYPS